MSGWPLFRPDYVCHLPFAILDLPSAPRPPHDISFQLLARLRVAQSSPFVSFVPSVPFGRPPPRPPPHPAALNFRGFARQRRAGKSVPQRGSSTPGKRPLRPEKERDPKLILPHQRNVNEQPRKPRRPNPESDTPVNSGPCVLFSAVIITLCAATAAILPLSETLASLLLTFGDAN